MLTEYFGNALIDKTFPNIGKKCFKFAADFAVNDLGERLKALRKRADLSQTALAEKIGVSYSQYGRYELKGVQPPANILNKLADILNTSVDYLINGDSDEKARATLKNTDLLQKFREIEAMPENEQHSIMNVINAYIRDFKTRQAYSL